MTALCICGCGVETSHESGVCQTCRRLYAPNLIRAASASGHYLLRTVSDADGIQAFVSCSIAGRWVTIRAVQGEALIDVDVQADQIVWVMEGTALERQAENEPRHDDEGHEPDWVTVLDEANRPIKQRCRRCRFERDVPDELLEQWKKSTRRGKR